MFLLTYRSSRHKTTNVTIAKYFVRDLRLSIDLLRENPLRSQEKNPGTIASFVRNLKEKLEKIHFEVRKWLRTRSSKMKS